MNTGNLILGVQTPFPVPSSQMLVDYSQYIFPGGGVHFCIYLDIFRAVLWLVLMK